MRMSKKAKEETKMNIEYSQDNIPPEKDDFFKVEGKDPNFYYHWAKNDPRRVHQLTREGYELAPATASESREQIRYQKQSLEKQLNNPDVSDANKRMAKEVLTMLENSPKDAPLGIPEAILMRTPIASRIKRMDAREAKSRKLEDAIESSLSDIDAGLKRTGKGGIEAFKELFDRIEERQRN